jgi:serine/threonine-protein kinase
MADRSQGTSATTLVSAPGEGAKGDAGTEPDPLIGRVIDGRFRVVAEIARGGMGKVYKAEQAPLGRVCALKVLSPKYEGNPDPEFHKRFFLEAATAAKLTHANTVTIFDYGQDADLYYIAMEYIEGRTLYRVLRAEGPFTEERVAHISAQICRSLREAHALGVVHRDLKPGNVLLSDHGDEHDQVKVLDFGLVKDITNESEDLTQQGVFMGSPKYMAPEQIMGSEITERTDIYALGVMMYEMLCGKVPFDRGKSVSTLMAHVNDPVPPMRQVNPNLRVSPAMEQLVLGCLDKSANKRPASMKDVLVALKRLATDEVALLETNEAMPRARVDSTVPSSSAVQLAAEGPRSGNGAVLVPLAKNSPSISETLSSGHGVPVDPPAGRSRAYVVGGIAAAAAVAIAAVLLVSGGAGNKTTGASDSATATPQPAPPSTATATATATAAAPVIRQVRVESDPPGASVSEGDTQLCTSTPCEVTWKGDAASAEHKLQVTTKGYKPVKLAVASGDEKAAAKLEAIPVAAAPPPAPAVTVPGPGRPLYKKDF